MRPYLLAFAAALIVLSTACTAGRTDLPTDVVLPNGLRLVVRERHANPLVAVDLWLRAGAREEMPAEYGAAHFLEHTLFKGTQTRKAGEVDAAIESLGGTLDAATGPDYAHFYTTVPSDQLDAAMAIIADVVMHATLPDAEVTRERGVILDELAQHDANAEDRLIDLLFEHAFQQGPYRRSPGGTATAISVRGRDTLASFYRRCYTPERAVLVLVGDVPIQTCMQTVARIFGPWKTTAPQSALAISDSQAMRICPLPRRLTVHTESAPLQIGIGFPAPAAGDITLETAGRVVAALLGRAGVRGRLNSGVLAASDANCLYVPRLDTTLFMVAAAVRGVKSDSDRDSSQLDRLEVALTHAIQSLSAVPPREDELADAKRNVLGHLQYDQETDEGLAHDMGYAAITSGEPPEVQRARIDRTTVQDVLRFVRQCLSSDRQLTIRMLPGDKITQGIR